MEQDFYIYYITVDHKKCGRSLTTHYYYLIEIYEILSYNIDYRIQCLI